MNNAQAEERFRKVMLTWEKLLARIEKQKQNREDFQNGVIDKKIPVEKECQD